MQWQVGQRLCGVGHPRRSRPGGDACGRAVVGCGGGLGGVGARGSSCSSSHLVILGVWGLGRYGLGVRSLLHDSQRHVWEDAAYSGGWCKGVCRKRTDLEATDVGGLSCAVGGLW